MLIENQKDRVSVCLFVCLFSKIEAFKSLVATTNKMTKHLFKYFFELLVLNSYPLLAQIHN